MSLIQVPVLIRIAMRTLLPHSPLQIKKDGGSNSSVSSGSSYNSGGTVLVLMVL